ncbi:MAG: ABC transporter permease [Thermomicrobiales bacterium]|nr:ABC transporter permease [Thermomicrobiales bacterium]
MFDFQRIRLIARREIGTTFQKKSYRIGLLLQVIIVALLAMSPIFIAKFTSNDDSPREQKIGVVDTTGSDVSTTLGYTLQMLDGDNTDTYALSTLTDESSARAAVENDDVDAAVVATREDGEMTFRIITSDGDVEDSLAQLLMTATSSVAVADRVQQAGLTQSQASQIFTAPDMDVTTTNSASGDDEDVNNVVTYVIAYASTIVIFLFIIMYGQWISQGVVEEKASRIMEIMVNAATPRDLLAGKVIGIMITALAQFLPMVLTVGIIASLQKQIGRLFGVKPEQLFDINLGSIAWSFIGWFTLYFILGFLLFGALYAGIGSLVSRQEEVSTAVAPMTTVMMVGYMSALLSMSNPDGMVARIAYLFPGTTVFVSMLRLVSGNPAPWEIAVSIIGLLIAVVLAMLFAARLYRVGVLMYGQRPGFKSLFTLRGMQEVSR